MYLYLSKVCLLSYPLVSFVLEGNNNLVCSIIPLWFAASDSLLVEDSVALYGLSKSGGIENFVMHNDI